MMANCNDRQAERPPLDCTISDTWMLVLVAACAAVVVWVAVGI